MRLRIITLELSLLGMHRIGRALWTYATTLLLIACSTPRAPAPAPKPPAVTGQFELASWPEVSGWNADRPQEVWNAFLSSCRTLRFRSEWSAPCAAANAVIDPSESAIRQYFEQYFDPYLMLRPGRSTHEDLGLITGYYEPQLKAARTASAEFKTPLYAPPSDLLTVDLASLFPELKGKRVRGRLEGKRVVPYYNRAELPSAPAVQGREIVWVSDPLDAFQLEIQGSGRAQLPDGEVIRLQYADQNGQPYRSIGKYLVDQHLLDVEQATMPGIRSWLAANPQRLQEVLNANPSVVFFTEVPIGDPSEGPKGAQGLPLTAGRSVAVDPAVIPLGSPVFLATTQPSSDAPLQRLVLAQDTGGAINGAPRADFFWGTGPEAGELAGRMRQQGRMWLVWPKGTPLPNRQTASGVPARPQN